MTDLLAGLTGKTAVAAARSLKHGMDPMPLVASQQSASAVSAPARGSISDTWAWWSAWFDPWFKPCIADAVDAPANAKTRMIDSTKRNISNTYWGYMALTSHEDVSP